MIKIKSSNIDTTKNMHIDAVIDCIKNKYSTEVVLKDIQQLPDMENGTIKTFLSANVETMRNWVENYPEKLQFKEFEQIYKTYFSNGSTKYVSDDYNAYKFLKNLDITVCPYCETEYLDIVQILSTKSRTIEIDHFFPKKKYPALAMCFYNLIPSGQNCNGLKKENILGKNPYEADIEESTFLYPDLPIGINMDNIDVKDCEIMFHARNGMEKNEFYLALEQRYKRHSEQAHQWLKNAQLYSPEKIKELVKMGLGSENEIIQTVFGPTDSNEKKKHLLQKMLYDLTGY